MTNEKMFSDVKQFALIFMPINWLICLIISLTLFFTLGKEVSSGYLLGAMTSFLTFGLLMKNTTNTLQHEKKSIRVSIFGGNLARLLISLAVLLSAFYVEGFNFYSTIAGLLVLKIVLIGFIFIRYVFFKDKVEENISKKDDEIVKEAIIDDITV